MMILTSVVKDVVNVQVAIVVVSTDGVVRVKPTVARTRVVNLNLVNVGK